MNENRSNEMHKVVGGRRMNVALNGELLEIFRDRGEVWINDVGKVLGGIQVFSCRAMGMNVKRRYRKE